MSDYNVGDIYFVDIPQLLNYIKRITPSHYDEFKSVYAVEILPHTKPNRYVEHYFVNARPITIKKYIKVKSLSIPTRTLVRKANI